MEHITTFDGPEEAALRGWVPAVSIEHSPPRGVSLVLANARLRGRAGRWSIVVRDGQVISVDPMDPGPGVLAPTQVDLGGRLVLPGFVDAHIHLDKAFQLDALEGLAEGHGDIAHALHSTAVLKRRLTLDDVEDGATRVIDLLARGGTVAARAHVEIGADTDSASVRMHTDLARRSPDVQFEFTAFAQHGTTHDPAIMRRMERAMHDGCTVVGGCPYADDDPLRHLDDVIGLARDSGAPLDLHLDLSDRLDDLLLGEVIPRVERAGLGGRTVVGHVTALSAAPPRQVRELSDAAARVGIAVVAIPTTDLFLSGRGGSCSPTRGVTRIKELMTAGVSVALGSNNYENAFTPVSMPSLSHAAWLASLTNHMGSKSEQLALLDAITAVPRSFFTRETPGIEIGDRLGAAVFDVPDAVDVVRSAARPVAVVTAHRGVAVTQPTGLGASAGQAT